MSIARIEVRSPDPSCNPYLALTLLIAAGMEGIEDGLTAKEFHGNVYLHHEGLQELPSSLQEALQLAQNSSFTKRVLGEELLQGFLNAKIKSATHVRRGDWSCYVLLVSTSRKPQEF